MINNKNKISYKLLLKHFIVSMILANIYLIIGNHSYNYVSISNSMAIIGLAYLIIGLFKVVLNLGFFDIFVFGFNKLFEIITKYNYSSKESKIGEYPDYINNAKSNRAYVELLIVSLSLISLSIIIAILNSSNCN